MIYSGHEKKINIDIEYNSATKTEELRKDTKNKEATLIYILLL